MSANNKTPQTAAKPDSSASIFLDLLVYFFLDKDRPPIWRLLLNSVLLVGSFALSIGVLFGLPMALIAILAAKSDPGHTFSLDRIGIHGAEVSVVVIVLGYLGIYLASVVSAYVARRMLVSDNVRYVQNITDSVSAQFDIAMRRNLCIPGLTIDRKLFDHLVTSGARALPRIHMTLLSGVMPGVFGLLSLATLVFIDPGLGAAVVALLVLSLPVFLRVVDRYTGLNERYAIDAKLFNEKFRATTGEAVFASEVERELSQGDGQLVAAKDGALEELAEHQDKFFKIFEAKQVVQDRMRLFVGLAMLIMLAGAFTYYLYTPWAKVSVGAIFALVLGLRYFIVAFTGMSASFVSLTTGHRDFVEIINFRRGIEWAMNDDAASHGAPSIKFLDLKTFENETIQPDKLDMIEVISDVPTSYANALTTYANLTGADAPVFFRRVAAIGFPGPNYRRIEDLNQWLENNNQAVEAALGLPPGIEKRSATQLKAAFEAEHFVKRKLQLPEPLWNMMSEWAFYQHRVNAEGETILLNGEIFARLPHLTRRMILEKHRNCAVIVIYRTPPKVFVSESEARFFVVLSNCVIAVANDTPSTVWQEELQRFEEGGVKLKAVS
ncbi:MAG: ABC transporter ATP-binding protein [Alphaproteobacteria bacterium]|nr:ABC transporter ATP-binding protein [Alphaproteobacteria bacterium]